MATRYESEHHPGERSWATVYGLALVRPLAACMLPVMLLTLVGVLEGLRVLPFAYWGAAAAVAVASGFTSYNLRRRIVEIQIDGPWVRMRSARDVTTGAEGIGSRVLDVRDYGAWADVTLGWSSYEIDRTEWPDYRMLVDALRHAHDLWYLERY